MTASPIAIAADYADAMLIARRAKNWLFLLLLLVLVTQVAIFFTIRLKSPAPTIPADDAAAPTTQPEPYVPPKAVEFIVAGTAFLGTALSVVLAFVQLLIVAIMLVGRLIGVSKVTGAFLWSIVLIVMLFPWQSLLASPEFPIPGVLYNWLELTHPIKGATFRSTPLTHMAYLCWARFVIWPTVSLILLTLIHVKSGRGLKMALGEIEVEGTP